MARIRYLKPEFFTDEDIGYLTVQARLAYSGLWCHADKAGRLEDRPRFLKTQLFPYDNVDMEKILALLSGPKQTGHGEPFILRYSVNGNKYIQIIKFLEHQKPHHTEKESTIPPPDNGEITVNEPLDNGSITPSKGSKREVKEKEKGKYLEFVLLTEDEHRRLVNKFGEERTKELIERLNRGIGSKGYKYKSHYYTILNWAARDKPSDITEKKVKTCHIPGCNSQHLMETNLIVHCRKHDPIRNPETNT